MREGCDFRIVRLRRFLEERDRGPVVHGHLLEVVVVEILTLAPRFHRRGLFRRWQRAPLLVASATKPTEAKFVFMILG